MEQAYSNLLEYGVLGAMVVILIVYIMILRSDYKKAKQTEREQMEAAWTEAATRHAEERKEYRELTEKQFDTVVSVAKESTSVMSELKTLIKASINK